MPERSIEDEAKALQSTPWAQRSLWSLGAISTARPDFLQAPAATALQTPVTCHGWHEEMQY